MNITQLPVRALTTHEGIVLQPLRTVSTLDIKGLLSATVVRFVVADVGSPLRWISENERFRFWKSEVQGHISDKEGNSLDDFEGTYFYFASEWRSAELNEAIILLEKQH